MILESKLNEGDKIFLFSYFPYDYKILPLKISNEIDLIVRPIEHDLSSDDFKLKPYRYILPMLNLNINPPRACIRITVNKIDRDELFGQIILAIRLIKPLQIGISGSFVHTKKDFCASPTLLWLSTVLNVSNPHKEQEYKYTAKDFETIAKVLKRIKSLKRNSNKFKRLSMALNSFTQITLGISTSYSMVYQELFACLSMIFGSAKGPILGKLIENFLKDMVPYSNKIGEWITKQYAKRNSVSHGNPEFLMLNTQSDKQKTQYRQFRLSISLKKYSEIHKLHEITRLCLLGLLGLKNNQLMPYNSFQSNGKERIDELQQQFLSKLKASPMFLKEQKIQMNHPYKKR